jgi:hypothetical protein
LDQPIRAVVFLLGGPSATAWPDGRKQALAVTTQRGATRTAEQLVLPATPGVPNWTLETTL